MTRPVSDDRVRRASGSRHPRWRRADGPVVIGPVGQALALALVPLVVLGLARFAYAVLLPAMRADLGWSYRQAAVPAVANGAGYLVGAWTAPAVQRRLGTTAALVGPLLLTALAIGSCAVTTQVWSASAARSVAGLAGGWTFVVGAELAATLRDRGVRGAVTWYPAGAGAGTAVAALAVPLTLPRPSSWPISWIALGVVGMVATAVVAVSCRATVHGVPGPARRLPTIGPAPLAADVRSSSVSARGSGHPPDRVLLVVYGCFGAGYVVFASYAVGSLADRGVPSTVQAAFWAVVGLSAVVAAPAWPSVQEHLGGRRPVTVPMALTGCGVLLLLATTHPGVVLASAVMFGGCFLAVVSGVVVLARRDHESVHRARQLSHLTTAFATGQMVGPLLATTDGVGPAVLRSAMLASAGLLLVGALAGELGPAPRKRADLSPSSHRPPSDGLEADEPPARSCPGR
ncbi:MAG: YbfB/YjiJ family MFS transporter [Phycicoccus sp.]